MPRNEIRSLCKVKRRKTACRLRRGVGRSTAKVLKVFDLLRRYGLPFFLSRPLSKRQKIARGRAMILQCKSAMIERTTLPLCEWSPPASKNCNLRPSITPTELFLIVVITFGVHDDMSAANNFDEIHHLY